MTTWSDLLTWDPEPLRQASAELTMTARRIYTVADDIGNARPSGDEWSGKSADEKTITKDDDWKYEFKDLPKYKNGKEIVYTVTENTVACLAW